MSTPPLSDRWVADRCHLCGCMGGHHPHCTADPASSPLENWDDEEQGH